MRIIDFIYVLIGLVVIVFIGNAMYRTPKKQQYPYQAHKFIRTKAEQKFYKILKKISDEKGIEISSKVRLWDLIYVPAGEKERFKFENKIKAKHIDFVLSEPETGEILLLIELDDSSHKRKDRKDSDIFKNEAIKAAGHKLVRFKTRKDYDMDTIREEIDLK